MCYVYFPQILQKQLYMPSDIHHKILPATLNTPTFTLCFFSIYQCFVTDFSGLAVLAWISYFLIRVLKPFVRGVV